ncbi:MAG: hypothetical protein JXQ72_14360 [Anaerolineae bacterium]|nr:hypothetical protein [Anaerolineae bacterium]
MSKFQRKLNRASKLVNQDKPQEALEIVRPILEEEPDNALAWWILAYAVDDPKQAHRALTKVLEIDPNFEHAEKTREMLAALNEEFPDLARQGDSLSFFPDPFSDGLFEDAAEPATAIAAAPAADSGFFEDDDNFADFFTATEEEPDLMSAHDMFADQSVFEGPETGEMAFLLEDESETPDISDEPSFLAAIESAASTAPTKRKDPLAFLATEDMSDNELASLEEKVGRQRQPEDKRRRMVLVGLGVILLAVVVIAVLLGLSGESQGNDPGELKIVEAEADQVALINDTVQSSVLGSERHAVLAESALGNTLFVEVCDQPGPALPSTIAQGMELVANQGAFLSGSVAAVGVSIDLCDDGARDSLYRAFVSLDDVRRYLAGDFGSGNDALARFQTVWQSP